MYLLDTNVISELVRAHPNQQVAARMQSAAGVSLFASVISIEEIRFGARTGPVGNRLWERTEGLVLPRLTIIDLDKPLAIFAADLRADWKRRGTPVGYADGLIGAMAKAKNLILVTRNVRHFDHVEGLVVENWFEPAAPSRSDDPAGHT